MKAVVVRELNAPVSVEDVTIDDPKPHEVLVRSVAAGLCHSDLGAIDGKVSMFPLPWCSATSRQAWSNELVARFLTSSRVIAL